MPAKKENVVSSAILAVFSLAIYLVVLPWTPGSSAMSMGANRVRELKDDLAFLRRESRCLE